MIYKGPLLQAGVLQILVLAWWFGIGTGLDGVIWIGDGKMSVYV